MARLINGVIFANYQMGSLHRLAAILVPDEKLLILIFDAHFFFLQKETSFIRDQHCHLAADGSPLH